MGRQQAGGRRAVCLRLTSLEDRTLPTSGLAASLSGGILKITDYSPGDTILLGQTPTSVNVTATNTNQTFTGVTRVTLDVQNTDTVTDNVSALGTTPARAVYLSRRDPTGATFVSSGNMVPGSTSGPTASTPPTSPTPPPATNPPPPTTTDWFSRELLDSGVQSLARSLAADGSISRQDMLALFTEIEQAGAVTANEIHDLNEVDKPDWTAGGATPNQIPLFTMPDSVCELESEVVGTDSANATYQGAALGNLQVGSTAAQLQKLVNKWFLGLDHPTASGTYVAVSGSLFGTGPVLTDVHQGSLSDCYFLAALASLAKSNPAAITSMFTDNGDGTYTVRFFDAGVAKYVTVDRMLPSSGGQLIYDGTGSSTTNANNVLWVALAEKAYAEVNAEGWLGHTAANSYPAVEEGYSDAALEQITGQNAGWTQIVQATTSQLQAAVAAGRPTILNSRPSPGNGVIADHTYSVIGYSATTQQFTLANPQGGSIQLTWTQINQSFSGFWQLQ